MRKEVDLAIDDEGRDKGKVFHLTEMPASRAEKWAMKALMLAARSGVSIPTSSGMGMQGIAAMGISALMAANFDDIEPLLDEMMQCVQIKESAPGKSPVVRSLFEEDIEEIATRIRIRQAVLELHVGFSIGGDASRSISATPPKQ